MLTPAASKITRSMEQTLALIKPDAVRLGKARDIFQLILKNDFTVLRQNKIQLREDDAMEFYKAHKGKPFYEKLVAFMTSGPIWAAALAKKDAIRQWRVLMGPTNSCMAKETDPASVRALYGTDGTYNAVHGSDSYESARREIKFFFSSWKSSVPPLQEEEIGDYVKSSMHSIESKLNPVLMKGLTVLAKTKPTSDSLEAAQFLGQWLIDNSPQNPTKTVPKAHNYKACTGVAVLENEESEETTKETLSSAKESRHEEVDVLLPAPLTSEETEAQAATIVQAAYKGYRTRKALRNEGLISL